MKVLPVIINYKIIATFIMTELLPFDSYRVFNDQNRLVGTIDVDEPCTHMERLMDVAGQVDQKPECITLAKRIIRAGTSLECTNANFKHIHHVMLDREVTAGLIAPAV